MSKRLTTIQKDEIVQAYRGGVNTNILAEEYNCSSNTINRTVKNLLSSSEYKLLKEKRLKSSNKKVEPDNDKNIDSKQKDLESQSSFKESQLKVNEDEQETIQNDNDFFNQDFNEIEFLSIGELSPSESLNNENSETENINQDIDNKFEEIEPLVSSFDFEKKEVNFEIHNHEILPESVYMLVDKKVELEIIAISELPEWRFLPENELNRNAILLFSNQRAAKRSCSRNQRVIKIPNTNVFEVSKSYLVLKGITRLILEDSIIALDN